jgi:hypothetical protein
MIKISIKNRFTGSIIFEYEKEDNTIKETLKEFIRQELEKGKSSANLSYADLSSADLSSANLSSANLSYANLSSADLSYADLSSADLSSANLSSANLSSANLSYADLDKRYIQVSCIGSSKRMTTYCFDDDAIWCGCFKGTLQEFEENVNKTHKNNEQYLKEYLGFINYVKSLK